MFYPILLILILCLLTLWLIRSRIRENRFLKKKTRETISETVQEELAEEKFETQRLKEKFEKLLDEKEK